MQAEEEPNQGFDDPKELVLLLAPHHRRDTAKYCAIRPFQGPGSPFVVLAWDLPKIAVYAPGSFDFDEHFPTALANLRKRETHAQWLEVDAPLPSGPVKVLVREGGWLTASDLCDPAFLRATAKRLGQDTVFFATPTRECMIASTDDQVVGGFAIEKLKRNDDGQFELGRQVYRFDGSELSLVGLVMEAGESKADVVGPRPAARGASKRRERPTVEFDTTPREPRDDAGHTPLGLRVSMPNGEFKMVLPLNEPDVIHVSAKVHHLLAERLPEYCSDPSFSGVVEFLVNGELIPDTPEQREMLERLRKRWTRDLEEKKTTTKKGRPVRLFAKIWSAKAPESLGPYAEPIPSPAAKQESPEERATREKQWEERRRAEELEAALRVQRRERALIWGASLCAFTALAGLVIALVREGASRFVLSPALTAVVAGAALALTRRGSPYGRAISGGLSLVLGLSGFWALTRDAGDRAGALLQALGVLEGVLCLAAGCCLLIGLERRPPDADTRYDAQRRLVGVILGCLLALFPGLPHARVCVPFVDPDPWIGPQYRTRTCRHLPANVCSKVPGCRVTEPVCAPNERGSAAWLRDCAVATTPAACARMSMHCDFLECIGTPTKGCSEFNATDCPAKLCETTAR